MPAALLRVMLATVLSIGLAGCAPDLNWREVRLDGWDGRAVFPCRPDHHERTLAVGGQLRVWRLSACEADGWHFALSQVEVSDPGQVDAVLRSLRQAATENLKAPVLEPVSSGWVGMTPFAEAGRWRLHGHAPDGRVRHMDFALLARGTRVVQAVVLGPSPYSELHAPFWEGVQSLGH